jgi:hypothetical protein
LIVNQTTQSSGSRVKIGDGTLHNTDPFSATGGWTVSGGTLKLGAEWAVGDLTVASGATLDLNGYGVSQSAGGSSYWTVNGSGLGGQGALINSNAATTPTVWNRMTFGSGATFGGAGSMNLRFHSASGTSNLINKVGSGTVGFEHFNTPSPLPRYDVQGGTLDIKSTGGNSGYNAMPAGNISTAAGATVRFTTYTDPTRLDTYNSSYAGVISGSGNVEVTGLSTMAFTGDNTHTGTTTLRTN